MIERKKKCPVCGGKIRTYTNVDECVYLSYCLSCPWIDSRQMFDTGSGIVVCEVGEAIEDGYLLMCPFTAEYVPAWMIKDYGMSIEHWHKIGKGSLTI